MIIPDFYYWFILGFNGKRVIQENFDPIKAPYKQIIRKRIVANYSALKATKRVIVGVLTIDKGDFDFAGVYIKDSLYTDFAAYFAFPLYKQGNNLTIKVEEIRSYNNIDGAIYGVCPCGEHLSIHYPFYFSDHPLIKRGETYEFSITSFIWSIKVISQPYEIIPEASVLLQWRESRSSYEEDRFVNDDDIRVLPYLKSDCNFGFVDYCGVVKKIETVQCDGVDVSKLTVICDNVTRESITLLCSIKILPAGLKPGDSIVGSMVIMGRISDQLHSSKRIKDTPFKFGLVKPPRKKPKPDLIDKAIAYILDFEIPDFLGIDKLFK